MMFAAIRGGDLVTAIVGLLVLGVVFWLLNWAIHYVNPPEPIKKVATVVLVLALVLVLVNFLLSLIGQPFIVWG